VGRGGGTRERKGLFSGERTPKKKTGSKGVIAVPNGKTRGGQPLYLGVRSQVGPTKRGRRGGKRAGQQKNSIRGIKKRKSGSRKEANTGVLGKGGRGL